jgi:hypothetical protein
MLPGELIGCVNSLVTSQAQRRLIGTAHNHGFRRLTRVTQHFHLSLYFSSPFHFIAVPGAGALSGIGVVRSGFI